jgi:hypothetical protein
MPHAIKAGLGCFLLILLLWAGGTYFLQLIDAEHFAQARHWHLWLPFYMTRAQDVPIFVAFAIALAILLPLSRFCGVFEITKRQIYLANGVLAGVAFAFVLWGSQGVYLDYPLSMDEYFAAYQAQVYASGAAVVPVPEEWSQFPLAFFHNFMGLLNGGHYWIANYLPIHSLFRASFFLLGAPEILNALAVSGSICLTAHIARRLFPGDLWAPIVAALLTVGSSQILIVGMSAYAHSMHLFLNLFWLALFMSDRRWAFVLLPWVGALAIGLHQVHYHLLFAFPFFAWMALQRRWQWLLYVCPIYGVAFLGFSNWFRVVEIVVGSGGTVELVGWATTHVKKAVAVAGGSGIWYSSFLGIMNFFRLIAWQHLLLLPLATVALFNWKRLPTVVKLLVIGCAITLVARFMVTPNPGHQWGYRYFHNMLGNVVLLAVAGLIYLREELPANWRPRLVRMLAWSSAISLFVLLPIRSVQVNEFVRPFAESSAYLESLPQDVVIIDTASIWIGQDLVRNDPWLRNRPLLLNKERLTADDIISLARDHTVVEVGFEDLRRFGMKRYSEDPK